METAGIISIVVFVAVVAFLFWKSKQRTFGTPSKTADGGETEEQDQTTTKRRRVP